MKIASSNIMSADYDRSKHILTLIFINRPRWVYHYYNISPRIWKEFVRADSKGTYFSQVIRDQYKYKKTIK